jgi:putative peptidoglycan lipid II flippase
MGLSLLGKGFGFWRELETARLFGVSAAMDAFVAASTLVFFLGRMTSSSFLVSVPKLVTEQQERGESAAVWGNLFRAILLVGLGFSLIAALLLPRLVPLVFSGLDEARQQLTAELVVWMLPLVIGWTLVGALGGILNTQHRYGGYQVALMVANVGILVVLGAFAHRIGITALAWGWSVGILLGVAFLALSLHSELRGLWHWTGLQHQWLVIRTLLGGALGLFFWFALTQIPLWLDRFFAAYLAPGSLSALGFAQRLFQLPLEMVTAVVMSVWVVRITEVPTETVVSQTFRVMGKLALVAFPVAGVLALFAQPIVALAYGRGVFGTQSITVTTGPFRMYALGLGFHTLSAVLVRTFQARGFTRYPVMTACTDILLTGILNAWMIAQGWGATGIAAVNTIVAAIRVGILSTLLYVIARRHGQLSLYSTAE